MGAERMKTGRAKRINQRMITCETQIHLKQISLMLHHPHLRVSAHPTKQSPSSSRRRRFSEMTNPLMGLSVSPRCKVEFRIERRPGVPMPE